MKSDYERLLACERVACVDSGFFFFPSEICGKNAREARENANKGPCIGGGVEWMRYNCTALKTPTKYPPPKSYTSPSPVAPSHSNYEPRAGRSEYNFLYCVNVRTYV